MSEQGILCLAVKCLAHRLLLVSGISFAVLLTCLWQLFAIGVYFLHIIPRLSEEPVQVRGSL
jgi:hypothetical protein